MLSIKLELLSVQFHPGLVALVVAVKVYKLFEQTGNGPATFILTVGNGLNVTVMELVSVQPNPFITCTKMV